MYNFMRPFMHQNTLDKVRIFGTNKEEWTAALLEEIDADNLPLHYGGTMVDPDGDPKCPSKVRFLDVSISSVLTSLGCKTFLFLIHLVKHRWPSPLFVLHEQ